jgi:hypothetical protein
LAVARSQRICSVARPRAAPPRTGTLLFESEVESGPKLVPPRPKNAGDGAPSAAAPKRTAEAGAFAAWAPRPAGLGSVEREIAGVAFGELAAAGEKSGSGRLFVVADASPSSVAESADGARIAGLCKTGSAAADAFAPCADRHVAAKLRPSAPVGVSKSPAAPDAVSPAPISPPKRAATADGRRPLSAWTAAPMLTEKVPGIDAGVATSERFGGGDGSSITPSRLQTSDNISSNAAPFPAFAAALSVAADRKGADESAIVERPVEKPSLSFMGPSSSRAHPPE